MNRATSPTLLRGSQLAVPIGLITVIGLMIVPVPAVLLDLLISVNIALSLVVLLTAVYMRNPVHFSVFPAVLLLLTVSRLGLNLASTRRILLHGHEGTHTAGSVIEAFGQFVVGGSLVVGVVMFLVLLAVQFVVINHGASRISEVAARFTLDAMPGKQMAIDADLNAGLIDEHEARERRRQIQDEADFYGSMDGAVRFTQRDAIASIIIVGINIIAGLVIGVGQQGLALSEGVATYSTLTVGDGLVTAIPALIISIAGGLITARTDSGEELGTDLAGQLLSNPRPLAVAAGALGVMGLIPGLPTVAFLTLAGGVGALAAALRRQPPAEEQEAPESETPSAAPEEPIEPLLLIDPLTIEVGYDLLEIAGSDRPDGLLDRIRGIRRQMALDLGMIVPPIRVRDNLRLESDEYVLQLRGATLARNRVPRGRVLAIDPGDVLEPIEGLPTTDPAFGIDALWIPEAAAERARHAGYTVVDRTSVIGTHLAELIRRHAAELLGRQDTQKLLDTLAERSPKLVEELIPERLSLGQLQAVLQALLRERVSIRDLQTICETLANVSGSPFDLEMAIAYVRRALSRSLVLPWLQDGELQVVTLSADVENSVRSLGESDGSAGDPRTAQALVHRLANTLRETPGSGQPVVLCSDPRARTTLRRLTETSLPTVPMLAVTEIPDGVRVTALAQVQ